MRTHRRVAPRHVLGQRQRQGGRSAAALARAFQRQAHDSEALDAARRADVDILLLVSARGGVTLEGAQFGTARFRNGRLATPLSFPLRAAAQPEPATLHVDFLVKGESVHQTELPLRVVTARGDGIMDARDTKRLRPVGDLTQDLRVLAGSVSSPPEQQIVLSLGMPGARFCIGLVDLRDGQAEFADDFHAAEVGSAELEALLKGVDAALKPTYGDTDLWESFDGDLSTAAAAELARGGLQIAVEASAAAGALLNTRLRNSPRIAAALDYIEQQAQPGAVISISTDNIFLPWEILYPLPWASHLTEEAKRANPLRPEAFWGARFAIETEKRGIGSLTALRTRHRDSPPLVSLNLNPDIRLPRLDDERQPVAVQRAWAKTLQGDGKLEGLHTSCGDMRRVLQDGVAQATILYVYCHGDSPHPFAGTREILLLDADCPLEPEDLQTGLPYKNAPIVFLNSCRSAGASPLAFGSFLKEFRKRGALGVIAASYAVPIVFGAHFGAEVVACCLQRSEALASAMLALRRRHLLENGNPVPLFYTLQCHFDGRRPRP